MTPSYYLKQKKKKLLVPSLSLHKSFKLAQNGEIIDNKSCRMLILMHGFLPEGCVRDSWS